MKKRILLADGDGGLLSIRCLRLRVEGYEVMTVEDGDAVAGAIDAYRPDVLMLDPVIAGGEDLLRAIRGNRRHDAMKVVINSATDFEARHDNFCSDLGVDACLAKPVEHDRLMGTLRKVLRDEITVTFWGTRGNIARPGIDTLKYGGNTPCVSVELSKDRYFVFDAGTGIADLGRALARVPRRYRINLFLSHPRWEHVQGLPYFQPLRRQGNDVVVHGPRQPRRGLREAMEAHAGHVCRPVATGEYASPLRFRELTEGEHRIDGLRVDAIELNHPSRAQGYRLQGESGQAIVYIADNELSPGDDRMRRRLAEFAAGADILIHDASYFDHEYRFNAGRGGSPLSEVLRLAAEARVKSLFLFNHDADHDDGEISAIEALARGYIEDLGLQLSCSAATEGVAVRLEAPESLLPRFAERARPALLQPS